MRNHGVPARSIEADMARPSTFHHRCSASRVSRCSISGSLLCKKLKGERRVSRTVMGAHVRPRAQARQAGWGLLQLPPAARVWTERDIKSPCDWRSGSRPSTMKRNFIQDIAACGLHCAPCAAHYGCNLELSMALPHYYCQSDG